MTDSQGKELHVGDRVSIPCVVTALLPDHALFDVEVQTELPDTGGYRPLIGLNARQVRHRAGRPPKRVRGVAAR